jgi:hypothetical protein
VITPPQLHVHCDASSSAAAPPIVTVAEPGVQAPSTGWHGCGVSVPLAALVADATCGLDSDVHIPNGGTFSVPVSSTTPAAAVAVTSVLDAENVDGVVPNEHCSVAPVLTWLGISRSFVGRREHTSRAAVRR